jgi:hypothetical protein
MNTKNYIMLFNRHYPAFLRFLVGVGDVLVTTAHTLIVAFGVPMVLILLLVVEHSRVEHGIALFEVDSSMASFAAWSLVLLNTILEFTIHYIESKAGYQRERQRRGSLRLYVSNLLYWLGVSKDWQPIELSPAHRYRRLLHLITFTILALALAGSMRHEIARESGAWFVALQAILMESTLSEMTTWLGGLLFAFAAVAGAQNLTAYLAVRVAEVTLQMQSEIQKQPEIRLPDVVWIEGTRLQNTASFSPYPLPEGQEHHAKSVQFVQNIKKHPVACECGKFAGEYDSEKQALLALNAHKRFCSLAGILPKNGHNGKH